MDGRGVISVGFPAKVVIYHFAASDFNGGDFHLATADGGVIVQTRLPNTEIIVNNRTVSVHSLKPDGGVIRSIGTVTCGRIKGVMKYT